MTQLQAPSRTLGQLTEEDRYRAFDDLQLMMGEAWDSIQKNLEDESVVVVPSISIERTTASSGTVMQAMEERALFLL
ncbi:MAG: peptide ligase PGM1-related protein, partial [Mycobacterium sp.]